MYAKEELSVVLANRAAAYSGMGKWEEALKDAEAVVKIKPQWAKGHFRKARALGGLQRHDEAREAVLVGLHYDGKNEDLMNALRDIDKTLDLRDSSGAPLATSTPLEITEAN